MITSQDKQLISSLIKKYAENIPTESMIAFVADTNGMLAVCKTLVNSNNNDDQFTISWVDEQCHDRKVDVRGFLYEVEQILSIFQPGHKIDEHYAALELEAGASDVEIKQAYRKLSRKYHPDTASSDDPANGDMFVKITKAYNALIDDEKGYAKIAISSPSVNHWREQKKHHVSRERKKKNLFWFAALAFVMIVTSLIVGSNYKQKAMIAGFQSSSAAFIPPDATIPRQKEETEQLVVDEEELVPSVEKMQEKVETSAETQVQITEIIEEEVEQQPLPPEEIQPPLTVTEATVPQIQTDPVTPAKEAESPAVVEIVTVVPVKKVKKKAKEPVASKKNEAVVKKTAKKDIKKTPVVIPIAKVVPVAPTEKEIQDKTQKKIEQFLSDYAKSYADKDLLSFTRFFDIDATENGEPLAEILPTYSDLFQNSDSMTLDISILKWYRSENNLHIAGRFKINIRYKNGDKVHGVGSISFQIREVEERLSIKETTYKFDNQ